MIFFYLQFLCEITYLFLGKIKMILNNFNKHHLLANFVPNLFFIYFICYDKVEEPIIFIATKSYYWPWSSMILINIIYYYLIVILFFCPVVTR